MSAAGGATVRSNRRSSGSGGSTQHAASERQPASKCPPPPPSLPAPPSSSTACRPCAGTCWPRGRTAREPAHKGGMRQKGGMRREASGVGRAPPAQASCPSSDGSRPAASAPHLPCSLTSRLSMRRSSSPPWRSSSARRALMAASSCSDGQQSDGRTLFSSGAGCRRLHTARDVWCACCARCALSPRPPPATPVSLPPPPALAAARRGRRSRWRPQTAEPAPAVVESAWRRAVWQQGRT